MWGKYIGFRVLPGEDSKGDILNRVSIRYGAGSAARDGSSEVRVDRIIFLLSGL